MKTLHGALLLITAAGAASLVPAPRLSHFTYDGSVMRASPREAGVVRAPQVRADLDGDGKEDEIALQDGGVEIRGAGGILFRSDPAWRVEQAEFGDLNRDGLPEAVLLVWRDFEPWPVDRLLAVGGRISSFHNARGQSCHLILIGWGKKGAREAWAGSALSSPVKGFAIGDLDGDGRQELATMDGDYNDPDSFPAKTVKIWEWNGFGFSRLEQIETPGRQLFISDQGDGSAGILISTY